MYGRRLTPLSSWLNSRWMQVMSKGESPHEGLSAFCTVPEPFDSHNASPAVSPRQGRTGPYDPFH